ncbi:MAG: response regulator [Myxococcales bacterium]|nr:response regulator [Myxococcales bacterium]MCB9522347.1 response regulator [Myxococcales bacterium]
MSRRHPLIVVADADARTARLCAEMMGEGRFVVEHCATAAAAQALIDAQPLAGLVCEVVLPDGDGLALARRARAKDRHLPVVVLTAEPTARTAAQAVRLGLDDYLLKHADSLSLLEKALRGAIRRHAREAEVRRLLDEMAALNDQFVDAVERLERANLALADRIAPPTPEEGAWRVLVVDDEANTVALLETLLRSQGYEVDGATSGAEARGLFTTRRYDVVLTDKNLGDESGVDLIGEIHRVDRSTRVLLMTGFATIESAADAMRLGAVGYLRKPFEDLQVVIDRLDEIITAIKEERAERRYMHQFKSRNSAFLARYRLIKNKLATLHDDG